MEPLTKSLRNRLDALLARADIEIDGERPWDIRVYEPRFFQRVFAEGTLGLGESWMDGWWDCEALDDMVCRAWHANLPSHVRPTRDLPRVALARLHNRQGRRRAWEVGLRHYDIGNELYRCMLDRRMIYSCGYWKSAADLDAAQEAKLDLVCRKLQLEPGMRVLDIGCGWGGAAAWAAERYEVSVVGVTVSRRQAALARLVTANLPVEIRVCDYRDISGRFDRIFSIGMFEHVGVRNYPRYFDLVRRCLIPDGLFLLHTIGSNESVACTDPWFERHIFPNSMLPSAAQITMAAEGRLVIEDWHNFGQDYDPTLMAWHDRFEAGWPHLDHSRYDERFRRMWRFYLLASAGGFRARSMQLWQIVFSPNGLPGGWRPANIR